MKSHFSGYLDHSLQPSLETLRTEPGRVYWDGGELSWVESREVSFASSDGKLCVSTGRPIFPTLVPGESDAARWLSYIGKHGDAGMATVSGGWSVLVVSPSKGDLILAVDRFSIQTACYAEEGSRISFAERADEVPALDRSIDQQSLYHYLHFHMIPAPRTVFKNVLRLNPAHHVKIAAGQFRQVPFWHARFNENKRMDFKAARAEFMRLVENAVRRDIPNEPVGAFLSGGTDSSTVAGMLCRATGASCDTYSIGFDSAGYDEMEYARIASRHFRTRHHEYYVTPDDLLSGIPAVAKYHDQPFGNSSAVPAFFCTRMAQADGMTRLLAGDGGDELFGGNSRYATQRLFDAYRFVPRALRQSVLEPLLADTEWPRKVPGLRQAGGYMRHSRVALPDRMETFNLIDSLGPENVLSGTFLTQIDRNAPLEHRRETWRECQADSLINRMLAYDWKFTLADSDLPKVRGATRMAGITVGFPLLDDALTDFSLTLEPEWKLKQF
jgi:asparagine synthase (glutamine-hydrolysing)